VQLAPIVIVLEDLRLRRPRYFENVPFAEHPTWAEFLSCSDCLNMEVIDWCAATIVDRALVVPAPRWLKPIAIRLSEWLDRLWTAWRPQSPHARFRMICLERKGWSRDRTVS
jgi:hypothetical protein